MIHGRCIFPKHERLHREVRHNVLDEISIVGDQELLLRYAIYSTVDLQLSGAQLTIQVVFREQQISASHITSMDHM